MRALWLLPLVACGRTSEGTAVGNPGNLDVSAVDAPADITLDAVEVGADQLVLDDCAGDGVTVIIDTWLDGLGRSSAVAVPAGQYCGATLVLQDVPEGGLLLEGRTTGGTEFSVGLDVPELVVDTAFSVDESDLLIAIPVAEILDAAALEALGPTVVLVPGDPEADLWALALDAPAVLWIDGDGSGTIGSPDVRVAAFDTGVRADAAYQAQGADAGCGCATSGGAGPWWGLLPWLALRARRRETPVSPR